MLHTNELITNTTTLGELIHFVPYLNTPQNILRVTKYLATLRVWGTCTPHLLFCSPPIDGR